MILVQKDKNKTKRNHKIKKKAVKMSVARKSPINHLRRTHMKMVSVCRNQNKAKFAKQSRKKKYGNFHFAAVLMIYMTVAISFRQGKATEIVDHVIL